jgi:3-oxoacyl-(acyl-carrier-protein) synthase
MGVVSPYGVGLEPLLNGVRSGNSAIQKWDVLEELGYGCQVCARPLEITDEIKKQYFTDLTIKFLQHNGVIYGSMAGLDAWKDAGLEKNEITDWDSGTIFGMGSSAVDLMVKRLLDLVDEKQIRRLGSTSVEQIMNSGISAYLAGFLGLGNHVTSNSSACSTGSESVIMGYERIKAGLANRMLCGGCDGYNQYSWAGFDSMRVLCRDSNDDPPRASRPMSAEASGFVPGAGAGALVIEDLETAQKRGARIYAEILGSGLNSGGQRMGGSMTKPNVEGVRRCMRMALDSSGIAPKDIDLIAGHLTSTLGDVLEVENWHEVLQLEGTDFPYINSTKSMIGHCLGGAGAIELVVALLEMQHGFVHPSLNTEALHPNIEAIVGRAKIPLQTVNTEVNIVAKSSFGFGDVNSCLVLRNWKN